MQGFELGDETVDTEGGEKDECATIGQSLPTDEHDEEEIRMLAMATRKDDDLDEENAESFCHG